MDTGALTRLGLRWFLVYLLLYMLPWIPLLGMLQAPIDAVTLQILHLLADPSYQPPALTGSGDTLLDWFRLPVLMILSVAGVAVWSVIDRRPGDGRVTRWVLWVAARYYLAAVMAVYGIAKMVRGQFPEPGAEVLLSTYADSSPMGLLWRFMGHSGPYTVLAGLAELVGGLLLLSRRTTTLGALVLVGVLGNVVLLNFSYDVPVKLFSTHLLLIALGLAAADWRRLAAVLLTAGSAPPRDLSPPVDGPRTRVTLGVLKAAAILYIVLFLAAERFLYEPPRSPPPALGGVYELEERDRSPAAWTRIVVERTDRLAVWTAGGEKLRCRYELYGEILEVHLPDQGSYRFRVERPEPDLLELHGEEVVLRLRVRDPDDFLLRSRGFHWVSEYPFNR